MRQQVKWSYRGIRQCNEAAPLIRCYLEHKTLAEIGFRYNLDDISAMEARAYYIIADEIEKMRALDEKKERLKHDSRSKN